MSLLRVLAAAVCVFGFVGVATAQEVPRAELTAGYSFLYDGSFSGSDHDIGGSFPLGWQASANLPLAPLVSAVVDLSGHYRSEESDSDRGVHGFHGGIRLSERGSGNVTPYAQLLAGVTHGAAQRVCWTTPTDGGCGVIGSDEMNFSIQPGAGAIVKVSDTVGIDLGMGYRLVFREQKAHEFRVHVGVAFLIGKK